MKTKINFALGITFYLLASFTILFQGENQVRLLVYFLVSITMLREFVFSVDGDD